MPRILLLLPTTTYRTEAFVAAAGQMDVEVTIGSEHPNALARLNPTAFLRLSFHDPQQTARQVWSSRSYSMCQSDAGQWLWLPSKAA